MCSIMKARKTMKNQPLIQEVISQISQRFTPKIPDIKKVRVLLKSKVVQILTTGRFRLSNTFWRKSISSE